MPETSRPKKLFELLAVEGQLRGQAKATVGQLRATFESKRHLFEEKRKTFAPFAEGQEPITEDESSIQSSVSKELLWIAGIWTKQLDVSLQVAYGDTQAFADVILDDGTVLLSNVPTTGLLDMSKRMGELQDLLNSVPTLDPAKGFQLDPNREDGVYKAREVVKTRTQKTVKPLVKAEATDKHPAQVEMISVDVPIGRLTEQEWSSLITPARKAQLLERIEELRRAITAACQRANAVQLDQLPTCGEKIFGYVLA